MKNLYHEHLDKCKQCRNSPFSLCAIGSLLLQQESNKLLKK